MIKLKVISELERDRNQSDTAISIFAKCDVSYVQKIRKEMYGLRYLKAQTELDYLEFCYCELGSIADDVIEYFLGEMEFNITRKELTRECAKHFGIRIAASEHAFECWLPAREKNRWRLAMNKKKRDVRMKK